jgi:hypothetical protein
MRLLSATLLGYGTPEGVTKAWDTRGRGRKTEEPTSEKISPDELKVGDEFQRPGDRASAGFGGKIVKVNRVTIKYHTEAYSPWVGYTVPAQDHTVQKSELFTRAPSKEDKLVQYGGGATTVTRDGKKFELGYSKQQLEAQGGPSCYPSKEEAEDKKRYIR